MSQLTEIILMYADGELDTQESSQIEKKILSGETTNLEEIEVIPPVSWTWKAFGYSIPLIIVGSIIYIGSSQGTLAARDNIIYWVLANGIPRWRSRF